MPERYWVVRGAKTGFFPVHSVFGERSAGEDDKIRELECRRMPAFREIPVFECDRRACDKCNQECSHTPDIRHAKNFHITHTEADGSIYFMEGER